MNTLKTVIMACALLVSVQYASAQSWAPPLSAPPTGNTFAPLNVGSAVQLKNVGLILNAATPGSDYGLVVPNGFISIGNSNLQPPVVGQSKIDVVGSINLSTGNCYKVNNVCISAGGTSIIGGADTNTVRYIGGTGWTASSVIRNNGSTVGVLANPDPNAALTVGGAIKITGGNPVAGRVLTTDATGLASWQAPASGGGSVSGAGTSNYVPKWVTNSSLGNSQIYDAGGNVGIGTTNPGAKLDVNGTVEVGNGGLTIDLGTNTRGSAGRDAINIIAGTGSDNDRGSILVNKPNFEFWNTTNGGMRANVIVKDVVAEDITLSGGNPAGWPNNKVLTSVDANGTAAWRRPLLSFDRCETVPITQGGGSQNQPGATNGNNQWLCGTSTSGEPGRARMLVDISSNDGDLGTDDYAYCCDIVVDYLQ